MTQEEYLQFIKLEMTRRDSLPKGEVDFLFGNNKEDAEALSLKLKENNIRHKFTKKASNHTSIDYDSFSVSVMLTPVGSMKCRANDILILSFDKSKMSGEEALQFIEDIKTSKLNLFHANFINLVNLCIEDVINIFELDRAVSRHMTTENWNVLVDLLSYRYLKDKKLLDALMMWKLSN